MLFFFSFLAEVDEGLKYLDALPFRRSVVKLESLTHALKGLVHVVKTLRILKCFRLGRLKI